MLTLVEGTAGAGKTIFCVERYIVPELSKKSGRKIITNIPLDLELLREVYGDVVDQTLFFADLSFDDVASYQNNSGEFLVGYHYIIDECQEHFTADQFDDTEVSKYFSRHRKYYCDITLVTQNPLLISKKLRSTVEICHYLVKRRVIGGTGYTLKTYAGKSSRGRPTNTVDGEYDPVLFKFYRSYTAEGLGLQEMAKVEVSFFTRFLVFSGKYLAPLFILIVTLSFVHIYRAFTRKPDVQPVVSQVKASPVPEKALPSDLVAKPQPARQPDPPKATVMPDYPGRLSGELCVFSDDGRYSCVAYVSADDGHKLNTTELAYAGHSVRRIARMIWAVDDLVLTPHHEPPPRSGLAKSSDSDAASVAEAFSSP